MNKQLIVLTSLLCVLNGQITYNEWKETRILDDIYAMPDNGIMVGELLLNIIDWITERPQLWNLDIHDLTLYVLVYLLYLNFDFDLDFGGDLPCGAGGNCDPVYS